ncbi:hypothetical protein ACFW4X_30035 [Streptomyces smyrnaeus]|uniref:hypothetical protein n=1 Tax=Streptomyces smyrnaeus TaxID=1387713 RepID=UPI003409BC3E
MHLAHHLTEIGRLQAEPTARIVALRTADPDPDGDPVELLEAEQDIRADHEALVVLLSQQWGEPKTVDLDALLPDAGDPVRPKEEEGVQLPEPERTLCWRVAELAVWTVGERWTGVGLARRGEGMPFQLLAAVGERGRRTPSLLG